MANKTIPALPDYGSQDSDKIRKDLLEITKNDGTYASPTYGTGASRKITVEELKTALAIISQTVTNGVTTKSPSEDAVFDAIYAKGLVKSNAWKNNGVGTFTLEADKYNIVNYSNTNIEILLPAVEVDKTIIVQGTTQDGSGAVNFTINNIKIGGADLGTPYSVTVTNEKEVLIFYGNYYGWHLIGHSNKTIDLSTKLDLDGGNANQDIDIDGFGVNAKHFKVNGTAGAGHIGLKHQSASITASASESSIGADSVGDPVWKNDGGAIDKLELQSKKDSTGGYVGLTLFKINFKNVLNTFTSFFTNSNTASRTYTFQNRDGIISDDTDLAIANNQVAYETWSTDANYTTQNTTAKRLIVLQTGTLTATRTLTLASVTGSGQEVIIVAGGSVTSSIKITVVTTGVGKINVTLNSFDITLPYSQTLLTSVSSISWTAQSASGSVFTDDGVTLETTRRLKADYFANGVKTSMTGIIGYGDFKSVLINSNRVGFSVNSSAGIKFIPSIDGVSYWSQEIGGNTFLKFWDGSDVGSGAYAPNTQNSYYGGWNYFSVSNPTTYIEGYYYNVATISQLIITKPTSNAGALQVALSGGKIAVTTNSGLTFAKQQLLNTWLNSELPLLNQKYSTTGLASYWTGSEGLGVGHSSQNASAILQADSTTKGFLPPRMTNTQRTNIVSPAIGLMVYCTDATEGLYIYKSTGWTFII